VVRGWFDHNLRRKTAELLFQRFIEKKISVLAIQKEGCTGVCRETKGVRIWSPDGATK